MDIQQRITATTNRKIWWLHFKEVPPELEGEEDFTFGTKAAIFEIFNKEQIGISLQYLQNRPGEVYQNKKVILRKIPFIQKKSKRGYASN